MKHYLFSLLSCGNQNNGATDCDFIMMIQEERNERWTFKRNGRNTEARRLTGTFRRRPSRVLLWGDPLLLVLVVVCLFLLDKGDHHAGLFVVGFTLERRRAYVSSSYCRACCQEKKRFVLQVASPAAGALSSVSRAPSSSSSSSEEEEEEYDLDMETYQTNLQIAALADQCAQQRLHRRSGQNRQNKSARRRQRRGASPTLMREQRRQQQKLAQNLAGVADDPVSMASEALRLLRTCRQPDTVAYNSVLKCMAKISPARIPKPSNPHLHLQEEGEGEDILTMVETAAPTSGSTEEEEGLVASSDVALDLLQEMKDLHQAQVLSNQRWYDDMAEGRLSDEAISLGPPRVFVKPNVRTYSTVMDALSSVGTIQTARKAEALLKELQATYDATGGDLALEPNLIAYNTLLNAYAKATTNGGGRGEVAIDGAGDGNSSMADKCLAILESMPIPPDVISYNAVLNALARSGEGNAGERAETLLRSMNQGGAKQQQHQAGTKRYSNNVPAAVEPNSRSYTTVMHAWSQCGNPVRAHELLDEMLQLHDAQMQQHQDPTTGRYHRHRDGRQQQQQYHLQSSGQQSQRDDDIANDGSASPLAPNAISFSTVIHAYAVSKVPDRARRAYAVFSEMRKRDIEPNRFTFNNLLNACAMSKASPDVMELLETLYETALRREPDHVTFGTVLKACGNLFYSNKKPTFAPRVFQEACQRGQVSRGVLRQLRQAVPVDTYRELVGVVGGGGGGQQQVDSATAATINDWKDLPREWTRNVKDDRERNWKQR